MVAGKLEEYEEAEGQTMITLDSSAVFALLNRRDPDHRRVKTALEQDGGPYLIPSSTLGEIAYLVEERLGSKTMDLFLADLLSGAFSLNCGEDELARTRELASKYV